MSAKHMSAMQLFGMKRQFLPTSDIFATPKLAVRSLDDVASASQRRIDCVQLRFSANQQRHYRL